MKLTSREREIVEALQKEPLISQDELAIHFGISRSSVAVHISNLMKKGVILGKGYVFNKKVSIVVVGQVYLEINIQEEADRNLIDMMYAGFGREVCKTLAGYGVTTQLITVVGNDDLGNSILNELQAYEVDIAHIYRHPEKRTCKKVVSNSGLRLEEGFAQKDFQQAIAAREWVVSNCDWLIVEPEFTELLGNKIMNQADRTPVLCGCWYGGANVPNYLKNYNLLVLGTANLKDYDYYINKGTELVETGTKNCIITDGSNNMIWVNDEGARDFPLPPNQSFDSSKDLPLFIAGLVHGLSAGYPMRQALRIASGVAHLNRDNG